MPKTHLSGTRAVLHTPLLPSKGDGAHTTWLRTNASGHCFCLGPKTSVPCRVACGVTIAALVAAAVTLGVILARILVPTNNAVLPASSVVPATLVVACPWGGYFPLNKNSTVGAPFGVESKVVAVSDWERVADSAGAAPAVLISLPDSVTLCWAAVNTSSSASTGAAASAGMMVSYVVEGATWWDGSTGQAIWATADGGEAGNSTHATLTGLLPATRVSFRVRAVVTAPGGESLRNVTSPELNVTLPSHGACGDASDIEQFHAHWDSLQPTIQGCLIGCILDPNRDSCAIACIESHLGFSGACSTCWLGLGQCTASECLGECLDPSSQACKQCAKAKCFPATVECTGIPMARFPGV